MNKTETTHSTQTKHNFQEIRQDVIDVLIIEDDEEFVVASKAFIDNRVRDLEENSQTGGEINGFTGNHHGFIHPAVEVKPAIVGTGFRVDDPEIYGVLLTTMRDGYGKPVFGGEQMDEQQYRKFMMYGVQFGMQEYFGNVIPSAEAQAERQRMVWQGAIMTVDEDDQVPEQPFSIADFKGRALCAERAAVAGNMLNLLGIDTTYIPGKRETASGKSELHAFLVFRNSKGDNVIYDPMNPGLIRSKEDVLVSVMPAVYPGGDEVLDGGTATVQHTDYSIVNGQPQPVKQTQRTFTGNFLSQSAA